MLVDATAYLAPYAPRRVRRPVLIALTEHTYPLEASPEQSWLPIACRAFARLAEPRSAPVRDLLIVGSGNGLDALGAADIFESRSMAITDLSDESVTTVSDNVRANVAGPEKSRDQFHAGDLLSCVPQKRRFDLIYENLPNIPATAEIGRRDIAFDARSFLCARTALVRPPAR